MKPVAGLVVVAGASTVGTLLVLALLIVPGASARLLTARLWWLFPAAAAVGAVSAWLGLSLGFAVSVGAGVDLPAGSTVVAVFVLVYALLLGIRLVRDRMTRTPARRQAGAVPRAPRGSRLEAVIEAAAGER